MPFYLSNDPGRKDPAYMIPSGFTASFMRTSASRAKRFFDGIKGWVDSHDKFIKQAKTEKAKQTATRDKQMASKLAHVLERSYVSLAAFLMSFRRHLYVLNKVLPGPYYLVVHANEHEKTGIMLPKSSAWLASIIEKELGTKHSRQGLLQVTKNKVQLVNSNNMVERQWPVTSGRNIVYVDDGIYSGQQLMAFCFALVGFLWEENKKKQKRGGMVTRSISGQQQGHTHVWVLVPYRTQLGQKTLAELDYGSFPDVMLEYLESADDIVKDVPDLYKAIKEGATLVDLADFAAEVLKFHIVNMNAFEPIPDKMKVFNDIGIKTNGMRGAGLTVFEHKVPDGMSFPTVLKYGHLIHKGKLSFASMPFERKVFVPMDDNKPYGHERPGMFTHLAGSRNNMALR